MSKRIDLIKIPKWAMYGFIVLVILMLLLSLLLYIIYFHELSIGNPKDFANFGTYIGGTLGSIIQFANLFLLIIMFHRQTLDTRNSAELQYVAFVAPVLVAEVRSCFEEMKNIGKEELDYVSKTDENSSNIEHFKVRLLDFLNKPLSITKLEAFESGLQPVSKQNPELKLIPRANLLEKLELYSYEIKRATELLNDLKENNASPVIFKQHLTQIESEMKNVEQLHSKLRFKSKNNFPSDRSQKESLEIDKNCNSIRKLVEYIKV